MRIIYIILIGFLAYTPVKAIAGETSAPSKTIKTFQLKQNYPNPFNPSTTIEFVLPREARVHLNVYNLLGQEIQTLFNGFLPEGLHKITWDGRDRAGNPVASGVYFYRLESGASVQVKRMVLIR